MVSQSKHLSEQLAIAQRSLETAATDAQALQQKLAASKEETRVSDELLAKERNRVIELDEGLQSLHAQKEQLEKERDEGLARERQMEQRYSELDVFKLDVIARELKNMDRQLETLRSESRSLSEAA